MVRVLRISFLFSVKYKRCHYLQSFKWQVTSQYHHECHQNACIMHKSYKPRKILWNPPENIFRTKQRVLTNKRQSLVPRYSAFAWVNLSVSSEEQLVHGPSSSTSVGPHIVQMEPRFGSHFISVAGVWLINANTSDDLSHWCPPLIWHWSKVVLVIYGQSLNGIHFILALNILLVSFNLGS